MKINFKILSILSGGLLMSCPSIYGAEDEGNGMNSGFRKYPNFFQPKEIDLNFRIMWAKSLRKTKKWIRPGSFFHRSLGSNKHVTLDEKQTRSRFPNSYFIKRCADLSVNEKLLRNYFVLKKNFLRENPKFRGDRTVDLKVYKEFSKRIKTPFLNLDETSFHFIKYFQQYFKPNVFKSLQVEDHKVFNRQRNLELFRKIRGEIVLFYPNINEEGLRVLFERKGLLKLFKDLKAYADFFFTQNCHMKAVLPEQFIIKADALSKGYSWLSVNDFMNYCPDIKSMNAYKDPTSEQLQIIEEQKEFQRAHVGTIVGSSPNEVAFPPQLLSAKKFVNLISSGLNLDKLRVLSLEARLVKPPRPGKEAFYLFDFVYALRDRKGNPFPSLRDLSLKLGLEPSEGEVNLQAILKKTTAIFKLSLEFENYLNRETIVLKDVNGMENLKSLKILSIAGYVYDQSPSLQEKIKNLKGLKSLTIRGYKDFSKNFQERFFSTILRNNTIEEINFADCPADLISKIGKDFFLGIENSFVSTEVLRIRFIKKPPTITVCPDFLKGEFIYGKCGRFSMDPNFPNKILYEKRI